MQGLLRLKRPGRPIVIPQVVRERFNYLCRPDSVPEQNTVYVIERELMVFRILKERFSPRKLTRWYRHLAQERNLGNRFLVFRRMRPAFKHLRPGEKWRFADRPRPKTTRDFAGIVRIDALNYAADRNPHDRELMRRAISTRHGIPLSKIAFGDEPHFRTADLAWGAIPEKLRPIDISSLEMAGWHPDLIKLRHGQPADRRNAPTRCKRSSRRPSNG